AHVTVTAPGAVRGGSVSNTLYRYDPVANSYQTLASYTTATATQAAAQVGPIPVRLTRAGKGVYDGSVSLPVAGSWEIDLVVTTSQFDATSTDAILRLH
ncbi:MAG: hypothetical protein QOJ37_3097, partial [Pseudonocardiales bacterium]|nr:hypothetical protein [Pseudonocardiales bacterium]